MFFKKVVYTLGLALLVYSPLNVNAMTPVESVNDVCVSKGNIVKMELKVKKLSDILRKEYSLYGKPPFEDAPIEEFEDYLMDGIPNPRSSELKNDKRYIKYLKYIEILNYFYCTR